METFATTRPCTLEQLPPLAAVTTSVGQPFVGFSRFPHATAGYLAFVDRQPIVNQPDPGLRGTVLVSTDLSDCVAAAYPSAMLLQVPDPRATFIDTIEYLRDNGGLCASSLLPANPSISPDAFIAAGAIVEAGAQVDAGVRIASGAVIRSGTWLQGGVQVGENSVLGTVGINAYVGLDGRRRDFPHLAGLIVGSDTNIGAGVVIVRGILTSTHIGRRCTVGNLCNVGHGVEIGADVWMSVGSLIGGHTAIGNGATIAMGCTLRDNIRIGAGANIGMGSVVTKHVRAGSSVFGNPARNVGSITAGPTR